MHLEDIRLINFKNYKDQGFTFSEEINCLVGENGVGKTNVLDAIYYLSITKSFLNTSDSQAINHDQPFFSIIGNFKKNAHKFNVSCKLKKGEKKVVDINKSPYDKLSDHIGLFPVVLITPNDTDIIRGSADIRRKYFDGVMSQLDRSYLDSLIKYNHALKQRNSILKQDEEGRNFDSDILEPYDRIIIEVGSKIYQFRSDFMREMIPFIRRHYEDISDQKEQIDVKYRSDHDSNSFQKNFKISMKRDMVLGRTSLGVHKDDYHIEIDGYPIRKFGSQGQQKSFVVALKLAQFEIMRNKNDFKPILLLDDLFDKLDEQRINKIMNMVAGHAFGQIFVTDAHPERTLAVFKKIKSGKKVFTIKDGEVISIE